MSQENPTYLASAHNKVSKASVNTTSYADSADVLIIGNGIAGLTAAVEARNLAPDARIVIITEQNHPTINTPALKQFAIGKLTREQLLAYPPGTERAQAIHLIHAHVEEINAQGKYVTMAGGRGFGYGSLLLATGSSATSLPAKLPGRDFDGVLTLHRLQDYLNLRRRLGEVEEAVVVGGGTHAIETVMGLLHWNIHVHWLIRSETFMPRILDPQASTMVLERVRQAGATIYTGAEVVGIVGRVGSVAGVVTNRQNFIPCQLVVACTGTKAVTTLAKHCSVPMKYDNGILVDDRLRSSVRDIYVAGDSAALKNPLTGKYEPRAQWYAAVLQGRIAGTTMAGQRETAKQVFGVPWHATLLGELSMLSVGTPLEVPDGAITLTDSGKGSYRRMTLADDRLLGYLSLGPAQPDSLAIKRIIDEGLSIRSIKKELLKGDFDARRYFSQQRTYAAQGMLTTGKLPSPATPAYNPAPTITRTLTTTNPLAAPLPVPYQGSPAPVAASAAFVPRQTEPLPEPASASRPRFEQSIIYEEEMFSPFTGSLPSLPPETAAQSWGASTVSAAQPARGSFWSYSDQMASVKVQQPSRSLWSYSEKHEGER